MSRDDMLVWISIAWFATLCGAAIWLFLNVWARWTRWEIVSARRRATLSIATPRTAITRHRNTAMSYVAVFCDWLAHVLPELSEISSGQLLDCLYFLIRDREIVQATRPNAHPLSW